MVETDEYNSRKYENSGGDNEEHIAEIQKLLVSGGPSAPCPQ